MVTLINVYDDELYDKELKNGWGFSCYIEHNDNNILFDTGSSPNDLLFNLEKIGIDVRKINTIVLSHNHWDHTGGIWTVIGTSNDVRVYVGRSFSGKFRNELANKGVKVFPVGDILHLEKDIWIGPEMGNKNLKEISLTIESSKGLIIITGCAHPGIVKVIKKVKSQLSKEIQLVLGGFHLRNMLNYDVKNVIESFRRLDVRKVAPCHCTGDKAIKMFKKEYGDKFIEFRLGSKIHIQ